MKKLLDLNANIQLLEHLVQKISKGYYSNFSEYNPDHSKIEENNDHSQIEEESDHLDPTGPEKIE